MKRVVLFQGLGVLAPNTPLPAGAWQRGEPPPGIDAATWYRTNNITASTRFPQTYPTPAANCRMCPPGDTSPDCCVSSDNMSLYRDFGADAYNSAVKPWNQDSMVFRAPPTTGEVVANAMQMSTRQSQLELAKPMNDLPPDPELQLSGFLGNGGQNQTHLLGLGNGQIQQHLLGLRGRVGCNSCNKGLAGTFKNDDGSFTTTGKVAVGVGIAAVAGVAYMAFRKKKR